ncbi:unnamed protein product [Diamesa hyperborea]
MEEVDAIILQSLREIGCEIEEEFNRLSQLDPELVFKCVSKLIRMIKPDVDIPNLLPSGMAQRFSACTLLVENCRNIGYKTGDLGYQTFLYSNVLELRRVLMWLIEHLPKDEDKTDSFQQPGISQTKMLENEISKKLANDLKRPWILEFLQKPTNIMFNPIHLQKPEIDSQMSVEFADYKRKYEPIIYHQTRDLIPSLIHTHDIDLFKNKIQQDDISTIVNKLRNATIKSTQSLNLLTSPTKSLASEISTEPTEEIVERKPLTRLEVLSDKVEKLKEQIEQQDEMYRESLMNKDDFIHSIEDETKKQEQLKKDKKIKMQVSMLLDNPLESKQKLQATLEMAAVRMENLNLKFEAHKQPLEEQLTSYTDLNSVKFLKTQELIDKINAVKVKITEIHVDIKYKKEHHQQLMTEFSKIKRATERVSYTSRIIDIIKSIKKQDNDINQILKETRDMQKSINSLNGQLGRQFTVTDDLLFKTAKRDEHSKKAYKLLIVLHSEFSELINLIESTGSIQRELRELEEHIENERQQNVGDKLEQITKDLYLLEESNEKN